MAKKKDNTIVYGLGAAALLFFGYKWYSSNETYTTEVPEIVQAEQSAVQEFLPVKTGGARPITPKPFERNTGGRPVVQLNSQGVPISQAALTRKAKLKAIHEAFKRNNG